VVLAKVNVDEAPNLAMAFRIEGIPAVKAFRDGRPILEFEGALPEPHLRQFLDRLVPSEADKRAADAAALADSDPKEAEKLYRSVLAEDPANARAQVGLAGLLVARNQDAEASALLDKVTAHEVQADVDRLRGVLELREVAASLATRQRFARSCRRSRRAPNCTINWVACWPPRAATRRRSTNCWLPDRRTRSWRRPGSRRRW
jgi:putative thioredoxin